MTELTKPQLQALIALKEHGGEGSISKHGYVVAGGEKLPFMGDTWLRRVTFGLGRARGPHRIGLTEAGDRAAVPPGRKINPDMIRPAAGRVEPARAAE